jgi:hypothetical protein
VTDRIDININADELLANAGLQRQVNRQLKALATAAEALVTAAEATASGGTRRGADDDYWRKRRGTRQRPAARRDDGDPRLYFIWIGQRQRQDDNGNEEDYRYLIGSANAKKWKQVECKKASPEILAIPDSTPRGPAELEWVNSVAPEWVDKLGIMHRQGYTTNTFRGTFGYAYTPNFHETGPFWAFTPRLSVGQGRVESESVALLPAGGDKAVAIIRRKIFESRSFTQYGIYYYGGGTITSNRFAAVPSPAYWADFERPYVIGRIEDGASLSSVTYIIEPDPSGSDIQTIEFKLMCGPDSPGFDYIIPGSARDLTDWLVASYDRQDDESPSQETAEIGNPADPGDFIWVMIKEATGGSVVGEGEIFQPTQYLNLLLLTGKSGTVGPSEFSMASWYYGVDFKGAGRGSATTADYLEAFLVGSDNIKPIDLPDKFQRGSEYLSVLFGEIDEGSNVLGFPELDVTGRDDIPPDSIVAIGGDPSRRGANSITIPVRLKVSKFSLSPSLGEGLLAIPVWGGAPASLQFPERTEGAVFPLRAGINIDALFPLGEGSQLGFDTYRGASTPGLFNLLQDIYLGDASLDPEVRKKYGIPKYDSAPDLRVGSMSLDVDVYTDDGLREFIDEGFVRVIQIKGQKDDGSDWRYGASRSRRFAEDYRLPYAAGEDESGTSTDYGLYYFTDWGKPAYCRNKLLELGFKEGDLSF